MNYSFDTLTHRLGGDSYKWNVDSQDPRLLPMWVADMDFRTAPAIIEALRSRVEHGIFGYTSVGNEYYSAVTDWFATRHGWTIDPRRIIYTSGVVPAVSAILKALTHPGQKVITQTPAYNCFFSSIRNNGCRLVSNQLIYNPVIGSYSIDFDLLERQAADPDTTVMILCNPHNPSGRVWTPEELRRIGDICRCNAVTVIADEIHCELTFGNHRYTPFASLGTEYAEICAACVSPSKAFNIAGLQIANIVAGTDELRTRIDRAINDNEVCDVNPFGVVATIAAYRRSGEWLDALKDYLWANYQYLRSEMASHYPQYVIAPLEGTYLAWLDITPSGLSGTEFCDRLLEATGLMLNPGLMYGAEGEYHIRMNLATQQSRLADAVSRLKAFIARISLGEVYL